MQKIVNALRVAFEQNLDPCIAEVAHIACQTIRQCGSIDKRAKADALHDPGYVEFDTQRVDLA